MKILMDVRSLILMGCLVKLLSLKYKKVLSVSEKLEFLFFQNYSFYDTSVLNLTLLFQRDHPFVLLL